MKVSQLRAIFEELADIYESAGGTERAEALRGLSRALQAADRKDVKDIVPALERSAAIVISSNTLASS
jgi:hypothetical protein